MTFSISGKFHSPGNRCCSFRQCKLWRTFITGFFCEIPNLTRISLTGNAIIFFYFCGFFFLSQACAVCQRLPGRSTRSVTPRSRLPCSPRWDTTDYSSPGSTTGTRTRGGPIRSCRSEHTLKKSSRYPFLPNLYCFTKNCRRLQACSLNRNFY